MERCLIGSMPTQAVWKDWIDRRCTLCTVIKKKNTSRITPLCLLSRGRLLGMEEFIYDLGWRVPDTFVYNNLFILSVIYISSFFFRWWGYSYGIWPDRTIFSSSSSTLQHVHWVNLGGVKHMRWVYFHALCKEINTQASSFCVKLLAMLVIFLFQNWYNWIINSTLIGMWLERSLCQNQSGPPKA